MKIKLLIISLALLACDKKTTKPSQPSQSTQVWCIYQNNQIGKQFLYCAKSQDEANTKYQQYFNNGLNPSIEVKSNCSQCQ